MGGSSSKSTIKQLTEISTNVATKSTQSCSGTAMQSQLLKIKSVKGDVKISGVNQRQGATVDMKCLFSNETQNAMKNDIAQEISNFAKAKGADLTGAFGGTKANQNMDIKNLFETNINNESVASQVSSIIQSQTLSAEDIDGSLIIEDVTQEQTAVVVAEAIINSSQYNGVLNTIATAIDAKSEAKGGGVFTAMFDMFGNMFQGLGTLAFYAMIIVVIVAIGAGLFYGGKYIMNKKGSGSSKSIGSIGSSKSIGSIGRSVGRIPPPPLKLRR